MNIPVLAITTGEPAGVGPDLALRRLKPASMRVAC